MSEPCAVHDSEHRCQDQSRIDHFFDFEVGVLACSGLLNWLISICLPNLDYMDEVEMDWARVLLTM